jgi:hypothetical protein
MAEEQVEGDETEEVRANFGGRAGGKKSMFY